MVDIWPVDHVLYRVEVHVLGLCDIGEGHNVVLLLVLIDPVNVGPVGKYHHSLWKSTIVKIEANLIQCVRIFFPLIKIQHMYNVVSVPINLSESISLLSLQGMSIKFYFHVAMTQLFWYANSSVVNCSLPGYQSKIFRFNGMYKVRMYSLNSQIYRMTIWDLLYHYQYSMIFCFINYFDVYSINIWYYTHQNLTYSTPLTHNILCLVLDFI